jgi:hypothetical protein
MELAELLEFAALLEDAGVKRPLDSLSAVDMILRDGDSLVIRGLARLKGLQCRTGPSLLSIAYFSFC